MTFQTDICSFRMTKNLKNKMEERSFALDMSPSEYFRYLIRKDLGEI